MPRKILKKWPTIKSYTRYGIECKQTENRLYLGEKTTINRAFSIRKFDIMRKGYSACSQIFSCFPLISVVWNMQLLNTIIKTICNIFHAIFVWKYVICCFVLVFLWCWSEIKYIVYDQFRQRKGQGWHNYLNS